ncbi:MAG: preprotein translocase subunit SecE [Phycisphaerales bacterium]
MALGICKYGQGYWVRVLTASLIGIAALAAGLWSMKQTTLAIDAFVPKSVLSVTLELDPTATEVAGGTSVILLGTPRAGEAAAQVGTATLLDTVRPGERSGRLGSITYAGTNTQAEIASITLSDGKPLGNVLQRNAQTAVEPIYVQGAVLSLFVIIGTVLAYWLVAVKPGSVEFLINTDYEMKKVNWSTRREIRGSTVVVVLAFFAIGAALFLFDIIFQSFFRLINVIPS